MHYSCSRSNKRDKLLCLSLWFISFIQLTNLLCASCFFCRTTWHLLQYPIPIFCKNKAGGQMKAPNEPPPPLASSTTLSTLTTSVATENICTSIDSLMNLIRVLRLSVVVMGEERLKEEEVECWEDGIVMQEICKETKGIEDELRELMGSTDWFYFILILFHGSWICLLACFLLEWIGWNELDGMKSLSKWSSDVP